MQICDAPLIRVRNGHVFNPVLIVLLDIDFHSLLGCLEVGAVLIVQLFLSLESLGLEIFQHFN